MRAAAWRGVAWRWVMAVILWPPSPAAALAVEAVLRVRKSLSLESIQIIKKAGGSLRVRGRRCEPATRPSGAGTRARP